MTKTEMSDLDISPRIMPSRQMGDNVASSSGTNLRSTLLGMGFKQSLVDKAIREKGEENFDLLLETVIGYSTIEKPQAVSSDSSDVRFIEDKDDLAVDSLPKEVVVKPEPADSLDSLERLFDDVDDTSSSLHINGDIKEEPDVNVLADDDRRPALLKMNFSLKEVNNAMATLGEDAPVIDLVDFIFAAQIAENQAPVPHENNVGRNQEAPIEPLFGTMDKTLRLIELGFTENQISAAIEKYGSETPITELADSMCRDALAGENQVPSTQIDKYYSGTGTSNDRFRDWGTENKPTHSCFDTTIQADAHKRDFELERYKGKRPKEEHIEDNASIIFKKPKEEFGEEDASSCYMGRGPIIPRRRAGKSMYMMDEITSPNLGKKSKSAEVSNTPPYFLYGNVQNLSESCWAKLSEFLFAIEPEFANTRFFSALSRREGYIHNLPRENRSHILPKPPMIIEQAIPSTKKWWPSWDTRKQISCISTEVNGTSQLCDRLGRLSKDSGGLLSTEQQMDIIHKCRTLNLLWVGRHKLAPIEPEQLETILGYPTNHTRFPEFSPTERLHSLKHCFQTDTLGYHLSVLKPLFPKGITVLSIYGGIGGALIALHRLGIFLKGVVAIEPCEVKRKVVKKWWENSIQTGELVQVEAIQKLTTSKIESLVKKFGGFDLVICQSPYTLSPKNGKIAAADDDSLGALEFSMFYEFVRVLQRVRSAMQRGV